MAFGLLKFPKNDNRYVWTDHSKSKMIQYFISESKIKGVIKKHDRIETGIAPNTVAVMARNDKGKKKQEMWVMYQHTNSAPSPVGFGNAKTPMRINKESIIKRGPMRFKIISVWRYPGVSPKKEVPIPEDVLKEINKQSEDNMSVSSPPHS